METSFELKCKILGQFWMNYRNESAFEEFIEYNDLGLPLAFAISEDIVEPSSRAKTYVTEAFDLLLETLEIEDDEGFEDIGEVILQGNM